MRSGLLLVLVSIGCGGGGQRPEFGAVEPDLDQARAPAAPGARAPEPAWSEGRRQEAPAEPRAVYRGKRIDLDFKDVDIADVFRLLADVGGVNIVVADDVKGKVTLRMRRVPWDQALVTVVKVKRLELERDGSVYLVRSALSSRE